MIFANDIKAMKPNKLIFYNAFFTLQMQRTIKKIIQHPINNPTTTKTAIMIITLSPSMVITVLFSHRSSPNSYPNSQAQRPFKSFFHAH